MKEKRRIAILRVLERLKDIEAATSAQGAAELRSVAAERASSLNQLQASMKHEIASVEVEALRFLPNYISAKKREIEAQKASLDAASRASKDADDVLAGKMRDAFALRLATDSIERESAVKQRRAEAARQVEDMVARPKPSRGRSTV